VINKTMVGVQGSPEGGIQEGHGVNDKRDLEAIYINYDLNKNT